MEAGDQCEVLSISDEF